MILYVSLSPTASLIELPGAIVFNVSLPFLTSPVPELKAFMTSGMAFKGSWENSAYAVKLDIISTAKALLLLTV